MIGDIVLYDNCIGVIIDTTDTKYTLATNYGSTVSVEKTECTPVVAAVQVLDIFKGAICKKVQ